MTGHSNESAARALRRGDLIHGGHLFLAGSMALWRVLESTPGISASQGGGFASSTWGYALAMISVIGGVIAVVMVAWLTLAQWREVQTTALFVSLALAAGRRHDIDVFDLVYLGLAAVLGVLWFGEQRIKLRAASRDT